jgi:adenine-specific DNA-methyltransferase
LRYYGGKGKLADRIYDLASNELQGDFTVADAFSGTGVIGLHFRNNGHKVLANDLMYFAHCLNISNLSLANSERFASLGGLDEAVNFLNSLKSRRGFLTSHFAPSGSSERQYFSTENAGKLDAMRFQLESWFKEGVLDLIGKEALIGLILRAVNRVSNVTGTYAAYLKSWDARALKPVILTASELNTLGPQGESHNLDVNSFLQSTQPDLTYLDPPYNARDYSSNYFLLELIALGHIPDGVQPKGITGMVAMPDKKSLFSSKRTVESAFDELLSSIRSRIAILSYSDEGLISIDRLKEKMSAFGEVEDFHTDHKRFRSINQDGSKSRTKEHLLVLRKG